MDWTGLEWAIKSDDHADDDWIGLDFPVYVYYYVPESGLSRSLGRYKIIERSKRWNLFTNPILLITRWRIYWFYHFLTMSLGSVAYWNCAVSDMSNL